MSRNRTATATSSAPVSQLDATIVTDANGSPTIGPVLDQDTEAKVEASMEASTEVRPCVKCGAPGYPYCKEHRASYQRDYVAQRMQMEANRGYAKGIEQMRLTLAAEFARLGNANLSGKEIAFAIMNAPSPYWPTS
jgi:hypothetical protein